MKGISFVVGKNLHETNSLFGARAKIRCPSTAGTRIFDTSKQWWSIISYDLITRHQSKNLPKHYEIPWIHIHHRILEHRPLQTSGGGNNVFRGTALAFHFIRRHARFPGWPVSPPSSRQWHYKPLFFPAPALQSPCKSWVQWARATMGPSIRLTLFWFPRRITISISVFFLP
jgi:hypothetical protein